MGLMVRDVRVPESEDYSMNPKSHTVSLIRGPFDTKNFEDASEMRARDRAHALAELHGTKYEEHDLGEFGYHFVIDAKDYYAN